VTTRKRLALFLLCLASFIAVVDTTIVSIALPSIRRELGFTGADAQWILNGYALTFGGLERVMNLGENRIEMRIPRSAWIPRDLRFPHS
jgi:hypothetical protein